MGTVGVVTGAGRGMGRACADRLASTVDTVFLVDLDESGANEAAEALASKGADAQAVALEVTDADGLSRLAARIAEAGSLRWVVHAAGISPTMADWRRVLAVDLVGTAKLLDALRALATVGTATVCFASIAARLMTGRADAAAGESILAGTVDDTTPDRLRDAVGAALEDSGVAYGWAKRGVQLLVEREAVRLGALGARICSVSPGMIQTPMGAQEMANQPAMAMLLDLTPLRREGQADEVAALVAFLVSDDAGFLTGCDILIDGGVCAAVAAATAG